MDNQTVGIIGAGHVGSHVAMSLVIQGICRRVVLIDTDAICLGRWRSRQGAMKI